ncbi:MAG: HupE/UreJ family protein [Alphaproteobacteria bacterium]
MIVRPLAVVAALLLGNAARAHHMDGGQMPATLAAGLLSGLGHPIIGWDHLAFVVGVGILTAARPQGMAGTLAFVAGTLGGCLVHLARIDLPEAETAVGLSLVLLALAVALGSRVGIAMTGALAAAGLVHGYAYGESIVGAEPTPVVAYLVGFALCQLAIGCLVRWSWRQATATGALRPTLEKVAAIVLWIAGMGALLA